jgi:hypothetical protein
MNSTPPIPLHIKTVRIEAQIPATQRDELERAIVEIISGDRSRMDALKSDMAAITHKALAALKVIETATI